MIKSTLKQHLLTSFVCLLLVLFSTQSIAMQLYRYTNEQGNLVIGHAIPPSFVSKGYDILNAQGRVIETVPAALSAEQIALRDALLEQEKQAKIAQAAQDEIDEKLKQLYSHPDDAVRILERRIQDFENVIQVKAARIDSAKKQIREEETLAANRQRKGLQITKTALAKIEALKNDITNAQADTVELKQEFKVILSEFDIKIRRLELIKSTKSEKYSALLKTLESSKHLADST